MITTWSERIRGEGKTEGRVEGKAEGRVEGKLELALRLLAQRFGTLPDNVGQRLAAIESTDELATLVERVFRGDSLEELGLA